MTILTGEQIRAGRALARISQAELADASALSVETIKRLERIHGQVGASRRTMETLAVAFRRLGIVFDAAGGVARIEPAGAPTHAQPDREAVPLRRLIYHSVMTAACQAALGGALTAILQTSHHNNARLALTGALLAVSGRFLQVLEGPQQALLDLFEQIRRDGRHQNVVVIENRPVNSRQFRDWAMCCGQLSMDQPPISAEPALRDGLRPELLSPAGALGLLCVVRDIQVRPLDS